MNYFDIIIIGGGQTAEAREILRILTSTPKVLIENMFETSCTGDSGGPGNKEEQA